MRFWEWKARLKLATLKAKLFYSAVFYLLLTMGSVGVLSCFLYWDMSLKKVYENNHNYNKTVQESISTIVQETINYGNSLIYDSQINSLLKEIFVSEYNSNTADLVKKLNFKLISAMEYRNEIVGISFITESRSFSRGDITQVKYNQILKEGFYARLNDHANTSMVLQDEHSGSIFLNKLGEKSIYVAGLARHEGPDWIILLKINPEFIATGKNNVKSLITNSVGDVVYSNIPWDHDELTRTITEKFKHAAEGSFAYRAQNFGQYISYNVSNYNGWVYASIMDSQAIEDQKRVVLLFAMFGGILIVGVLSGLAWLLSSKLIAPLTRLGESIRNIRDFDCSVEEAGNKKIGEYWLGKINFKGKLMLFYSSLIVCCALIFIAVFYQYTRSIIVGQVMETAVGSLDQTARNIEFVMRKSERISAYISINESIQDAISGHHGNGSVVNDISSYIINEGFLKNGISYMDFYSADWKKVYSTEAADTYLDSVDQSLVTSFKETMFYKQWLRLKQGIMKEYTISFVRKIRSRDSGQALYSVIGYIDLGVDESYIEQKYEMVKWVKNSGTMIIDNENIIVSAEDKKQIGKSLKQVFPQVNTDSGENVSSFSSDRGETYYMLSSPVKAFGWKLILVIPQKELMGEYFKVLTSNIIAVLFIIIIMLEIVNLFSNWISKPLYMIKRGLNEVRIGNLDVDISYKGRDEFGLLSESFRDVMGRLNDLFDELYQGKLREKELENRKKEVQLICLQQQINPHFLYNTFSSIKFLIKMGRTEEAAEMVTMVGDMFRIGVYRGRIIVDIREELEHIRAYLTIQQIRYRDKLSVIWHVDEGLYRYKTLKFILQPVIENAIYHGIEVMEGQGLLTIRAVGTSDTVCFEISDNGPGMDATKLQAVNAQMQGKGQARSIGLRNVDERIKMYFGEQFGLGIESKPGLGTTVRIVIPAILEADANGGAND